MIFILAGILTLSLCHDFALPLDHERVKSFIEKTASDVESSMPEGLPHVNIDHWIAGGVLIEDEEKSEMTDD